MFQRVRKEERRTEEGGDRQGDVERKKKGRESVKEEQKVKERKGGGIKSSYKGQKKYIKRVRRQERTQGDKERKEGVEKKL